MSPWPIVAGFRRWFPQTFRFRLSFYYAALFLAAGALLLGLTYVLVAKSLPKTTGLSALASRQRAELTLACKQAEQALASEGGPKAGGGSPPVGHLPTPCRELAAADADAAAAHARAQTLHNLLLYSLVGLGAMTLASGGLGWVMAGRALRPVSAIAGAARRASEHHLGERLGLEGPRDELKELADTFDEMLDRLDVAFSSQRRFVADASHELRTPLTVMRTAIDVTLAKPDRSKAQLEGMAAKVRRSLDQAERLIDALLTMAVSQAGLVTTEPLDLATVAEDAIDAAAPEIDRLNLQVTTSFERAETRGERSLLERLVGNLVDNAVCHNLPEGWIEVRSGTNGKGAYIEVSNSGRLIDEELVLALFEPFRRVDGRTSTADGVGLGLAIVRSIATAHRGTLEAHSQLEGGLKISLHLAAEDGDDPKRF